MPLTDVGKETSPVGDAASPSGDAASQGRDDASPVGDAALLSGDEASPSGEAPTLTRDEAMLSADEATLMKEEAVPSGEEVTRNVAGGTATGYKGSAQEGEWLSVRLCRLLRNSSKKPIFFEVTVSLSDTLAALDELEN